MDTGAYWSTEASEPVAEDRAVPLRTPSLTNDPAATPAGGEPFHYRTERTLQLRDLEPMLGPELRPRTRDRDVEVVVVRATTRNGAVRRVVPVALPDALFLDFRDLAAIEAGGIVPDLGEALGELAKARRSGRG